MGVVIRVDKDKGYIDLSKRRVSKEDIERCTEKYSKAKAVNSIARHVAEILGIKTNEELEDLTGKPRGTSRLVLRSRELLTTTSNNQLPTQPFSTPSTLTRTRRRCLLRTSRGSSPSRSSRSGRISSVHVSPTRESM